MTKIIFSGYGGQGVLSLGQIVAYIAMKKGYNVTWMPSYGAEMRGGTANCTVIISDKIIGSPIVSTNIDILCAMNVPSINKFIDNVRTGGNVYLNSSIITNPVNKEDLSILKIDATNIATKIGNPKVSNMVMIAGFIKTTSLFSIQDVESVLEERFSKKYPDLIPLNIEAIKKGISDSIAC